MPTTTSRQTPDLATCAAAAAALVLAFEPFRWLVGTWTHPAFDSPGGWFFALAVALLVASVRTPVTERRRSHGCDGASSRREAGVRRRALGLLAATAAVRAIGIVLAVDVLGGFALAIDVYAIGVLLRIDRRRFALGPGWLATLFALSLPLERLVQRVVGYPLQQLSAVGACRLLRLGFDPVTCAGVRIRVDGMDTLVDLPCAGTQSIYIVAAVFLVCAAVLRPSARASVAGAALALGSSLAGNALRIAALSAGLARPDLVMGFDLAAKGPHDAVGLVALAVTLAPLVAWARRQARGPGGAGLAHPSWTRREPSPTVSGPAGEIAGVASARPRSAHRPDTRRRSGDPWRKLITAFAIGGLAVLVMSLPERPVDVSAPFPDLRLPGSLGGRLAVDEPLTERERATYEAHGGTALRVRYGDDTLLVVRTSAPLRHLHAPDECLAAAGFRVEKLGVSWAPVPSAVYRATDPDGRPWRVAVTFVSDDGVVATSVAEVVWRWLRSPRSVWTGAQRISPWVDYPASALVFDQLVAAALDLPLAPPVLSPEPSPSHPPLAVNRHHSESTP